MADSDQEALVRTLVRIGHRHPDMVTWWENMVNELHQNAMGNNTVNEIREAFNTINSEINNETVPDEQKILSILKECADLLEAWWKVAGSPAHSTELALKDAYRILEQKKMCSYVHIGTARDVLG
ncbi:hypothetical protein LCGC14_2450550 [marine sediment metagenome]|uniref:Uncharacterized protein n=1 Tax=marine sediment metagenome TaxID=412755 RepID=A0A0F9DTC5_9ZZZZ